MRKHLVVLLAYDQLCTFEFGCAVEIFALPRPELTVEWYDFAVCAVDRGPIRAAGGISLKVRYAPQLLDQADTIIVAGWRDLSGEPPLRLLQRLRDSHSRGARIASICSGVFLLAATGLLDGRSATTHWRFAGELAERYPAIKVKPNELYVDEGQLITSAGSAAGLDMMLHLVRRDHGSRVANVVAQRLVVSPHRQGDQAQFVPRPVQNDEISRLTELMTWLRSHLGQAHALSSMARRAKLSQRTLQRRFLEATGMTPIEWLVRERVSLARDMLETSKSDMERIAQRCGFGSSESFRRNFRRFIGTNPTAYRRQFNRGQQV
jgi:AraC family transcriptional regulator, transcriptional activator FtrA